MSSVLRKPLIFVILDKSSLLISLVDKLFLIHLLYCVFVGLDIDITSQQFNILSGMKLICSVNKIYLISILILMMDNFS